MLSISVVTLAQGRSAHLANMVLGLMRQTQRPLELVVARMQAEPYNLPEAPFPIRQIALPADPLPLAAARNRAVAEAVGEGILMGEVLYLPGDATQGEWTTEAFAAIAEKHSDRQGPPAGDIEICSDYRCFWSLNFAMRRATFLRTGGFDEGYTGYGGEDTDFGKTLDQQGVAIAWVRGGRAYHQYHPHHMPPIHHLDSVVRNAERFEAKWGYRTMGHWLYAFRRMGLIDDTPGRPIRILREPNADDLALTGQESHQPYSNTASVLRALDARLAAGTVPEPA
jgi:hypothetical protein